MCIFNKAPSKAIHCSLSVTKVNTHHAIQPAITSGPCMASLFQVYTNRSILCSHSDLTAFAQPLCENTYFNLMVPNMRMRSAVSEEKGDNTFFEDISHAYILS